MANFTRGWFKKNAAVLLTNLLGSILVTLVGVSTCSSFKEPVGPPQREIRAHQGTTMNVTAYVPAKPRGAAQRKLIVGRDAAVSRDRLDLLGKDVYVLCPNTPVGLRTVIDLTAEGVENTLDITMPDKKTALDFGVEQCSVIPLKD